MTCSSMRQLLNAKHSNFLSPSDIVTSLKVLESSKRPDPAGQSQRGVDEDMGDVLWHVNSRLTHKELLGGNLRRHCKDDLSSHSWASGFEKSVLCLRVYK